MRQHCNILQDRNVLINGTYIFTGPSETDSVRNNPSFIMEGLAFAVS